MGDSIRPGPVLFGLGIAALGLENVIYSDFVLGLEPVPSWVPGRLFWAYLTGFVLIAAGGCMIVNRRACLAAFWSGLMLFLWVLLLQAPRLALNLHDGNAWTTAFETLALCGAAWVLADTPGSQRDVPPGWASVWKLTRLGRFFFGISLPVFGILHFVYARFVATLVPAWIPGHLFWAYFVGAAFVAAGVSIVTKVKPRLAATLLGLMFGTWVLILHLPRALAHSHARPEWTSLFIALAMCGGSWLVVATFSREDLTGRTDPRG